MRKVDEGEEMSLNILVMAYKNMSLNHLCKSCLPFLPRAKRDIIRLGSGVEEDAAVMTTQEEAKILLEENEQYPER